MKEINFNEVATFIHNAKQDEKQRGSAFIEYIDLVIALRQNNIRHTHIVAYLNDKVGLKGEFRKTNNQLAKMIYYWKAKKLINYDNVEILAKRYASESNTLITKQFPKSLATSSYSFDEWHKRYYFLNRGKLESSEIESAKSHYELYKSIKTLDENVEAYINLKNLNQNRV